MGSALSCCRKSYTHTDDDDVTGMPQLAERSAQSCCNKSEGVVDDLVARGTRQPDKLDVAPPAEVPPEVVSPLGGSSQPGEAAKMRSTYSASLGSDRMDRTDRTNLTNHTILTNRSNASAEVALPLGGPPQRSEAPKTCSASSDGPGSKVGDPRWHGRWDIIGFNKWCDEANIAWIFVGFLRRTLLEEALIPERRLDNDLPTGAAHYGAPPSDAQLYAVAFTRLSHHHPDPDGIHLKQLTSDLDSDGAQDTDLVFWAPCSVYQLAEKDRSCHSGLPAEEQQRIRRIHDMIRPQQSWRDKVFIHFRIRSVILPEPETHETEYPFFRYVITVFFFVLSTFTQRIVNQTHPAIAQHMTPEFLIQFQRMTQESQDIHMSGDDRLKAETEHWRFVSPEGGCYFQMYREARRQVGKSLLHARDDSEGFQAACQHAGFRWVLVSFVFELAARGGPPPRCQDLPPGSYIDGVVPDGRQPFVVSYSWSSHKHPCPSGRKLQELARALQNLDAKLDDLVFLDWMSLWQGKVTLPQIYADLNQSATYSSSSSSFIELPDRSNEQARQFKICLFETTRLYAFRGDSRVKGCKVIVLPKLEKPEDFPDCGTIQEQLNDFCNPPRRETHTDWGFCKSIPYERGGWTSAEYAVARKNGTIANSSDPDVIRVENSREWPASVAQYAKMMREDIPSSDQVVFTNKGDREAVRFNFYKYSYHMLDE